MFYVRDKYRGCKWLDKKKRKEKSGWTYAELHKVWRLSRREAKLNGWQKCSFKEFRDSLLTIIP